MTTVTSNSVAVTITAPPPSGETLLQRCTQIAAGSHEQFGSDLAFAPTNAIAWQQQWNYANGFGHLLMKSQVGSDNRLRYHRFNNATSSWEQQYVDYPSQNGGNAGHIWGGNPFDPATGTQYWQDDSVPLPKHMLRWNGAGWTTQFNSGDGTAEACCFVWHPDLGKIVSWVENTISSWTAGGAQTVLRTTTETTRGGYYAVGFYYPAEHSVVMFSGDSTKRAYAIGPTGVVTLLSALSPVNVNSAPDQYSTLGSRGVVTLGRTGDLLILRQGYTDVWKLNWSTQTWSSAGTHPIMSYIVNDDGNYNWVNANLYTGTEYCVLAICGRYGGGARFAIWKPSV